MTPAEQLPAPLVPAEVDLRDFGFMPLDVRTLLTSSFWIKAKKDPRVAHAAMSLWCEAWHQVPAASLPNDDDVLAELARCDEKEWKRVKDRALAHFVECSDGRLYHRHVAKKALESWASKQAQRERTRKATEARKKPPAPPDGDGTTGNGGPSPRRDDDRNGPRDDQRHDARDDQRDVHQGTVKGREGIDNPQPPEGGKRRRKPNPEGSTCLRTWLESLKTRQEQPVPPDDPVFAYAQRVGIPREFLALGWRQFRHRYSEQHPGKRYRDWRRVFRNAVEGNWLKLWWLDPASGQYALTTVGLQAQRSHEQQQGGKAA